MLAWFYCIHLKIVQQFYCFQEFTMLHCTSWLSLCTCIMFHKVAFMYRSVYCNALCLYIYLFFFFFGFYRKTLLKPFHCWFKTITADQQLENIMVSHFISLFVFSCVNFILFFTCMHLILVLEKSRACSPPHLKV